MILKRYLFLLFILLVTRQTFSQYSQLQLGDTTKSEYPYLLPIFGEAAYDKGFDIPKPVGLMINYFWAIQDIIIPEIVCHYQYKTELPH